MNDIREKIFNYILTMVVEKKIKVAPEEAFICTLLHNLGKIISQRICSARPSHA